MTIDELKSMPKGHFIVMKTGFHPMKTRLKLFFKWGIQFENAYSIEEKSERKDQYADSRDVKAAMPDKFLPKAELSMATYHPQKSIPIDFENEYENPEAEEILSRKHSPKTRKVR